MEKQIISMEAKKNIMAHMENLLDEYDYEYTEPAINKIINKWASQKADLIDLLSKHPNYVEGEFLIAFNKDWNREIDPDGAEQFAEWLIENAEAIRANLPSCIIQQREAEVAAAVTSRELFDRYFPLTQNLKFLTHCPRRIYFSNCKRKPCISS